MLCLKWTRVIVPSVLLFILYIQCTYGQEEVEAPIARPNSLPSSRLLDVKRFFNLFGTKYQKRWLVVAGRKIFPSSIYRIAVELMKKNVPDEDIPLTIEASITHNGYQMTSAKTRVDPGELSEILLKIPDESIIGQWVLSVEGRETQSNVIVFQNSTELVFRPEFLTILIETSRPVYNAGSNVKFRAVMITKELLAYDEPTDVHVLDPRGVIMRRWPSRQTGEGILTLDFDLPEYPLLGNWTIQIRARNQIENKTIVVEQYFRPRFEVFVRMAHAFKVTDDYITGVVVANMTNWRDVYGNCSIKLQVGTNDVFPVPTEFRDVYEQYDYNFTGIYDFKLPIEKIRERVGTDLEGMIIRVLATVGEAFTWQIKEGWAMARLFQERARVIVLGDQPIFFKPGMPLTVHVLVSYSDGHPMDEEELDGAFLTISFGSSQTSLFTINGTTILENNGVAEATAVIPEDAQSLTIAARFVGSSGLDGSGSMVGMRHFSPQEYHIQIETTSRDTKPGEYIILHVRNNFYISYFNYAVISNGLLISSGREPVLDTSFPTVTTFAIPASAEMAPVAKILVWVMDQNENIVAHSIGIPVDPLGRHEVSIRWNEHKDHGGGSAEIKMIGESGAAFASAAIWEETYWMDSGCSISESRVLLHMLGMLHFQKVDYVNVTVPHVRAAITRSREGLGANVQLQATSNAGPDALTTFNFSDVMLFTNAKVNNYPGRVLDNQECEKGYLMCLTGGCYAYAQRCDGKPDCGDLSDEAGCPLNIDPYHQFRLYRLSRLWRFYDGAPEDDGDWSWREVRAYGNEIQVYPIPKRPQTWIWSMYAVGKTQGLGILSEVVSSDSAGPFMLTLDAPKVARMWEQVGLTVGVFNYHVKQVGVLVTLDYSPKYSSIYIERHGVVSSYDPKTVSGTFQHVMWLPPSSARDIHIPIVFREMGDIEITVVGSTQMMTDSDTRTIKVIPEGCQIQKHTSILLDLKDRALVYEFFNIHLDESPIIPYSLIRRYIFGTPQGHVSITGDIVGPSFPSIPVDTDSLLGLDVMSAETSSYDFAANIWSLHYLRLTNQMTDSMQFQVLEKTNVHLAALVRYQQGNGGFVNWIGSEQSVWLTAHALRCLWAANFQEWEDYIYIDNVVINRGVQFILEHQTAHGSFHETQAYLHPLDTKVDPRSRHDWLPQYQNVSLTAHVVITLTYVQDAVSGDLYRATNLAKQRAIRYLERLLDQLDDAYDVAVVTWALTKANSDLKEVAFGKLDSLKRVNGDRVYWSREPVGFLTLIYEDSQRPYYQPKDDQKWDAHSVESTAYALLTYVEREGIGILQENIVRFLASMRELDGGLISTLDSIVAMEALVQYAFRARLREITNMDVIIELSGNPNHTIHETLTNTMELSNMRSHDLTELWGHVSIRGKGSGQALLQLDYTYGVDVENQLDIPPVPSFEFELEARYSGRNSSYVNITSCQRWINTNETETSGVTVIDIHLPSGYYIMQDELIEMVMAQKVKNLRWAYRTDTSVKFFFNRIEPQPFCFSYRVERWFPVSNHSRHNQAMIYDLYQPERFKMNLFEVFPLYALDICEVCGSYQCPFCPWYSSAPFIDVTSIIFINSICLLVVMTFTQNLKTDVSRTRTSLYRIS